MVLYSLMFLLAESKLEDKTDYVTPKNFSKSEALRNFS